MQNAFLESLLRSCSSEMSVPRDDLTIYVLKCAQNKYYVGKTRKFDARWLSHLAKDGSAWTTLFPPLEVLQYYPKASPFEEDRVVMEMIHTYGVENVRGGSYCTVQLTSAQLEEIARRLQSAIDRCYRCNGVGHFADACTFGRVPAACIILESRALPPPIDPPNFKLTQPQVLVLPVASPVASRACFRCGRTSHYARACFASTHIDGHVLDSPPRAPVPAPPQIAVQPYPQPHVHLQQSRDRSPSPRRDISTVAVRTRSRSPQSHRCYRCGRGSHFVQECFAVRDLNGRYLT